MQHMLEPVMRFFNHAQALAGLDYSSVEVDLFLLLLLVVVVALSFLPWLLSLLLLLFFVLTVVVVVVVVVDFLAVGVGVALSFKNPILDDLYDVCWYKRVCWVC